MKTITPLLVVCSLLGCAAQQPLTPEQVRQMEPPECTTVPACGTMWQRAQIWLVDNSHWRIQMANDTLLQTYGPSDHSTDVAYTITRQPNGQNGYKIVMRAVCNNIYGCSPLSPVQRVIQFNNHLRSSPGG
jgi:hypothetical protein